MNHYPHHLGDYAKDTRGLTQGQHGAYRLLMDAAYASEAGVAEDEVYVIGCATTPAERKNVDKVLAKFFTLRDGHYHQKRIDEEVSAYRSRSEEASAAARSRWDKERARKDAGKDATAYANASSPASNPQSNGIESASASAMLANNQKPEKTNHPVNLISESSNIPAHASRVAAMDAILALDGRVNCDARGRMHLRQFADEGVTDQQLADAIAIARDHKPHPEIIPFAYLVPIVAQVRSGTASRPQQSIEEAKADGLRRIEELERREAERRALNEMRGRANAA